MHRFISMLIIFILSATVLFVTGCDTSAERELKRAEKALDEALDAGADATATEDYNAADELLREATQLAADDRVQEARNAAIKSKIRSEDAKRKADERQRILNDEMDRLGR